MVRVFRMLAGLLAVHSSMLFAADCSGLKDLKLADTSITLAETVTSGELKIEGAEAPMRDLPAFCRVAGLLRPTSDSEIRFEVWLPEQGWNGRYLGVGNGGFAGSIGYQEFANYLKRGFAVAGSDAGHQADGTDASWAYGHPEKVKDFGWRAVHLTAVRARQIITAYYGKPEQKAYFDACSDGGREALMEAQRFQRITTASSPGRRPMRGQPCWPREYLECRISSEIPGAISPTRSCLQFRKQRSTRAMLRTA